MRKVYLNRHLLLTIVLITTVVYSAYAQNGVRIARTTGTADPSAILDIVSDGTPTWKGFLLPRMTDSQKSSIPTPAAGLLVYQTDGSPGLYYYNGSAWVQLSAGALSGSGTPNTIAKWTASNAINNSQIVDDGTNVGIGIANPTQKFQVVGGNVQINNLAGTGLRDVYVNANGLLMANGPANATVFSYTGSDQSYTVPGGTTSVTIKLWGAGGGGGYFGGWVNAFSGGGGGFTQGVLAVSPGQTLTVIVGGGGTGGNIANMAFSYGGGARSCNTGSDCRYGGQGGGRSAVRNGGTELLTAGGGGGGGSTRGASISQAGGAGGGIQGQNGMSGQNMFGGGVGGGPTAGGVGAQDVSGPGGAGSQFTGGVPGSNAYGGGGGGGWFGGGGGGYSESHTMGGGGGGSGYTGGAGVTSAYTLPGFFIQPPKTDDMHYANGVGVGGLTVGQSVPLQGGHGRVVIIPNN